MKFWTNVAAPLALFLAPSVAAAASWESGLADQLRASLSDGFGWLPLTIGLLGGLLTAATPCVYPLIPITVRYFAAVQNSNRRHVFGLALTYVAGMAVFYATLGTAFAASSQVFGSFLANRWVLTLIGVFCALMGASMLGAITLQLPFTLHQRLNRVGGHSHAGAFGMGLVSGLIAAPCTGPVLAVILTVIAQTGAILAGFALMLSFSVGLGLPFLLLAVSSSTLQHLPKAGPWMEGVKAILSAAMFVVAFYFLSIAWPLLLNPMKASGLRPWMGGALLGLGVAAGVGYLFVTTARVKNLSKGLSIGFVTVGAIIMVFSGGHSMASPAGNSIPWVRSHAVALAAARASGKPLMIDFTADWCIACKELDEKTYTDERVIQQAERFVSVQLDATEVTPEIETLFERYSVLGLPTVVFLDAKGALLPEPRVTGFVPADEFVKLMAKVQ